MCSCCWKIVYIYCTRYNKEVFRNLASSKNANVPQKFVKHLGFSIGLVVPSATPVASCLSVDVDSSIDTLRFLNVDNNHTRWYFAGLVDTINVDGGVGGCRGQKSCTLKFARLDTVNVDVHI